MENLHFKTTEEAFEYAKLYFTKHELSAGASFIGIVRHVDMSKAPTVYVVEIACSVRKLLKSKKSLIVAAIDHPDLKSNIAKDDLVVVGLEEILEKIPSGFVIHKLTPEVDLNTGTFKVTEDSKKFKVFVDDNFQYMKEDERYLFSEYDNLDDAIEACKKIVDESIEHLMNDCALSELLERYKNFGDDPFIHGGNFSAWEYAKNKIDGLILKRRKEDHACNLWKYQIDHTYGLLLRESEILEEPGLIYFSQTDRRKLCVSWSVDLQVWKVNVNRSQLDGLSFSTVKRFEDVAFCEDDDLLNYRNKQYLIELLLNGVKAEEKKELTLNLDDCARIEFTLSSAAWNGMLIGNLIEIKGGSCHFFEGENSEPKVIPFGLTCEGWDLEIEYIIDHNEGIEGKKLQLKELGNYYS